MEQRFISAIARDTYGRDARLAAGGGHSDLYMHMYKRETMILREDFRRNQVYRLTQARVRGPEARGDAGGGARRGGQSRPQPACLRVAPLGVGYMEGSGNDEARPGRVEQSRRRA